MIWNIWCAGKCFQSQMYLFQTKCFCYIRRYPNRQRYCSQRPWCYQSYPEMGPPFVPKTRKSNQGFLLKQTIPWNTPSHVKNSLYYSTVVSVLLYASPLWTASFTILQKLERFQKRSFYWIFGRNISHELQLVKNRILPLSLQIEFNCICLLLDLLNGK